MIDKEKIILMSRLAVYDKNDGQADRKKLSYYRNDYLYRQNIGVRFCAMVGSAILIGFYLIHRLAVDGVDLLGGLDLKAELIRIMTFVVLMLIVYSCIGTVIHMADYQRAVKRSRQYHRTVDELETLAGPQEPKTRPMPRPGNDNGAV